MRNNTLLLGLLLLLAPLSLSLAQMPVPVAQIQAKDSKAGEVEDSSADAIDLAFVDLVSQPPPEPTAEQSIAIKKLLRDFANENFLVRENASRKIWEMGRVAEPALAELLKTTSDSEVGFRAQRILRDFQYGILVDTPHETVEVIKKFRNGTSAEKGAMLQRLAVRGSIDIVLHLLQLESTLELNQSLSDTILTSIEGKLSELILKGEFNKVVTVYDVLANRSNNESTHGKYIAFAAAAGQLDFVKKKLQRRFNEEARSSLLARIYWLEGDKEKALEYAKKSSNEVLQIALLMECGRWNELAGIFYNRAVNKKSFNYDTLCYYFCLQQVGDFKTQSEHYKEYVGSLGQPVVRGGGPFGGVPATSRNQSRIRPEGWAAVENYDKAIRESLYSGNDSNNPAFSKDTTAFDLYNLQLRYGQAFKMFGFESTDLKNEKTKKAIDLLSRKMFDSSIEPEGDYPLLKGKIHVYIFNYLEKALPVFAQNGEREFLGELLKSLLLGDEASVVRRGIPTGPAADTLPSQVLPLLDGLVDPAWLLKMRNYYVANTFAPTASWFPTLFDTDHVAKSLTGTRGVRWSFGMPPRSETGKFWVELFKQRMEKKREPLRTKLEKEGVITNEMTEQQVEKILAKKVPTPDYYTLISALFLPESRRGVPLEKVREEIARADKEVRAGLGADSNIDLTSFLKAAAETALLRGDDATAKKYLLELNEASASLSDLFHVCLLLELAQIYEREGDWNEAIKLYKSLYLKSEGIIDLKELQEDDAKESQMYGILVFQGNAAIQLGRAVEGKRLKRTAEFLAGTNPDLLYQVSDALRAVGDVERANDVAQRITRLIHCIPHAETNRNPNVAPRYNYSIDLAVSQSTLHALNTLARDCEKTDPRQAANYWQQIVLRLLCHPEDALSDNPIIQSATTEYISSAAKAKTTEQRFDAANFAKLIADIRIAKARDYLNQLTTKASQPKPETPKPAAAPEEPAAPADEGDPFDPGLPEGMLSLEDLHRDQFEMRLDGKRFYIPLDERKREDLLRAIRIEIDRATNAVAGDVTLVENLAPRLAKLGLTEEARLLLDKTTAAYEKAAAFCVKSKKLKDGLARLKKTRASLGL